MFNSSVTNLKASQSKSKIKGNTSKRPQSVYRSTSKQHINYKQHYQTNVPNRKSTVCEGKKMSKYINIDKQTPIKCQAKNTNLDRSLAQLSSSREFLNRSLYQQKSKQSASNSFLNTNINNYSSIRNYKKITEMSLNSSQQDIPTSKYRQHLEFTKRRELCESVTEVRSFNQL